ncbi:MAG: hypothetical protein ACE5HM_08580 [Acidiferrobacterales bacterium]
MGQVTDAFTCDANAMTIATKAKRIDLETTISTLTPLDQLRGAELLHPGL